LDGLHVPLRFSHQPVGNCTNLEVYLYLQRVPFFELKAYVFALIVWTGKYVAGIE